MIQADYNFIRHSLHNGDVIAFGGTSLASTIIRSVTSSNVSHVGAVLRTNTIYGTPIVQIIESTSLEKQRAGVMVSRLSTRIQAYSGTIWIVPLSTHIRRQMDTRAYIEFMLAQKGKPYDYKQAFHSAIDNIFPDTEADFSKLFCSELVTAGLQAGNVALSAYSSSSSLNPSEQTPLDVVKFPIYDDPIQVKGRKPMDFF